jgi:hypothetical protein
MGYEDNKRAVWFMIGVLVLVILGITTECRICTIMENPPDWIDSWYDGPPKDFGRNSVTE